MNGRAFTKVKCGVSNCVRGFMNKLTENYSSKGPPPEF